MWKGDGISNGRHQNRILEKANEHLTRNNENLKVRLKEETERRNALIQELKREAEKKEIDTKKEKQALQEELQKMREKRKEQAGSSESQIDE